MEIPEGGKKAGRIRVQRDRFYRSRASAASTDRVGCVADRGAERNLAAHYLCDEVLIGKPVTRNAVYSTPGISIAGCR